MSMNRLRENDCPKMVKKLCKNENEGIAKRANQIIKKWTKIIQSVTEKNASSATNISTTASGTGDGKEKKRKSMSGIEMQNNKKLKTSKSIEANNPSTTITTKSSALDSGESSTTSDNFTGATTTNVESNNTDASSKISSIGAKEASQTIIRMRPSTVKVKQGKFRLNLAETTATAKPISTARKKGGPLTNVKSEEIKKLMARSIGNASGNSSVKTFTTAAAGSTNPPVVNSCNHVLKVVTS